MQSMSTPELGKRGATLAGVLAEGITLVDGKQVNLSLASTPAAPLTFSLSWPKPGRFIFFHVSTHVSSQDQV